MLESVWIVSSQVEAQMNKTEEKIVAGDEAFFCVIHVEQPGSRQKYTQRSLTQRI